MTDENIHPTQGESPAPETPAVEPAGAEQEPSHAPSGGGRRDAGDRGGRPGWGRRQGGRGPGGRGGRRGQGEPEPEADSGGFEETVVRVYRCATVVKGGRRFSFGALVVVGDRNGQVGVGYGKANEVPAAVEKAVKAARRNVERVCLHGTTVPHRVMAKYRASKVLLQPANKGTGVIAGASVRAVMEMAGVKDVLTKVHGSTSPKNLVKAALEGLRRMRSREQIEKLRKVALV